MTLKHLKESCFCYKYVVRCERLRYGVPTLWVNELQVPSPSPTTSTTVLGGCANADGRHWLYRTSTCFSWKILFACHHRRLFQIPWMYPLSDMTTSLVIESVRDFFSPFGFPDCVLIDIGTQFESQEFKNYLSKFGIKKSSTTIYHPSSDGLCERFSKTIQGKLLSFLTENNALQHQWLNFLMSALFSYRSSIHSTTGFRHR